MVAIGSSLVVYPAAELPLVAVAQRRAAGDRERRAHAATTTSPTSSYAGAPGRCSARRSSGDRALRQAQEPLVEITLGGLDRLDHPATPERGRARPRRAAWCTGRPGSRQSACLTSSSSSVQPRITPCAPSSQSSSMTLDDGATGGVEDLPVHQLVVDDPVDLCRGAARRGTTTSQAVRGEPVHEERPLHGERRAQQPDRGQPARWCTPRATTSARWTNGMLDGRLDLVGDACGTQSCTSAAGRPRQPRRHERPRASSAATSSQRSACCSSVSSANSTELEHHEARRVQAPEPVLDPSVQQQVVLAGCSPSSSRRRVRCSARARVCHSCGCVVRLCFPKTVRRGCLCRCSGIDLGHDLLGPVLPDHPALPARTHCQPPTRTLSSASGREAR